MPTLRGFPLSSQSEPDALLLRVYAFLTFMRGVTHPNLWDPEATDLYLHIEDYLQKPPTGTIRRPAQPSQELAERRRKRMRLIIDPDSTAS